MCSQTLRLNEKLLLVLESKSCNPHESQLNLAKRLSSTSHSTYGSSSSSVIFAHFKQQICHPLLNGTEVSRCLESFWLVPPQILCTLFFTSIWFLRILSQNLIPTCKLFLCYLVTNFHLKVYVMLIDTRFMVYIDYAATRTDQFQTDFQDFHCSKMGKWQKNLLNEVQIKHWHIFFSFKIVWDRIHCYNLQFKHIPSDAWPLNWKKKVLWI
jgi:hypothetical protein